LIDALGQYKVLDRIGHGRMGDLYRARDTRHGRTVALRVLDDAIAQDPERREQFLRDARAGAAVSHPNVAGTYEIGEDAGTYFLASEFVSGQPLKRLIGARPLNPRTALDLGAQIADALAEAHAGDICHGHLTCENILVTSKGHAKILDLGLAAWTASGEKKAGQDEGPQADIGALGLVLFEMLTGKKPSGVRTLSVVNPNLPRELDPIVLKTLVKKRGEKYESAATLAAELRAVLAILDVRNEEEPVEMGSLAPSRPRSMWLLALLAIGAAIVLVWAATRAA
jgi:serine/threonine protein kinase